MYGFEVMGETRLSSQRGSSSLLDLSPLSFTLVQTLGQQLSVLSSSISLLLSVVDLLSLQSSLSLQSLRGDQSLDLWSLRVGLTVLLDSSSDNVVSNVVLLGQTEELSDVVSSLRAQSLWGGDIGQTLNLSITLLDNSQSNDRQVLRDDTSSNGLSLSLTISSGSVTRVTLRQQQSNSGWVQHTLLHWETLLVVTTSDLEDVTLEFVTDRVTLDLLAHTLLVEDTQLVLVLDLNALLGTVSWVGDV